MKRLLLAFAAIAAVGLSAESALAQGPPPGFAPGPVAQAGSGEHMYGGHAHGVPMGGPGRYGMGGTGFLSRLFTNHTQGTRQQRTRNAQMLPTAQGGTLVFPQNPFVRSPRDFFMWDEK